MPVSERRFYGISDDSVRGPSCFVRGPPGERVEVSFVRPGSSKVVVCTFTTFSTGMPVDIGSCKDYHVVHSRFVEPDVRNSASGVANASSVALRATIECANEFLATATFVAHAEFFGDDALRLSLSDGGFSGFTPIDAEGEGGATWPRER